MAYNFLVKRGKIDLLEVILGTPRGLARIEFEDFRATFIPDSITQKQKSKKKRSKKKKGSKEEEEEEEEVHQTEIQLVLQKFSLYELLPSRLKHGNYTTLLCSSSFAHAEKAQEDGAQPGSPNPPTPNISENFSHEIFSIPRALYEAAVHTAFSTQPRAFFILFKQRSEASI